MDSNFRDQQNDEPELPVPSWPSGRRRGWQGEELEMEHQRDASRNDKGKIAAAVDIRQFQNHVVGEGYQAKHVVRQATAGSSAVKVKDMTGGANRDATNNNRKPLFVSSPHRPEKYMENTGLREFRKEIENILSS